MDVPGLVQHSMERAFAQGPGWATMVEQVSVPWLAAPQAPVGKSGSAQSWPLLATHAPVCLGHDSAGISGLAV